MLDRLKTYRAKRDFTRTAEPAGKPRKSGKKLSYFVQKHAARRLHYDFRLEWNGALMSWAVPKGPSENLGDKRLAVHVEDHPIEYGIFEGTIPKSEYGGGTVLLWDRGSWEPHGDVDEGMKKGKLGFTLHGERLKGNWALVRLHGRDKKNHGRDNWLLIKEKDSVAKSGGKLAVERATTSVKSGRDMEEIAEGMKTVRSHRSNKSHDDIAEIEGVRVTHPDRALFASEHVTKRDIANYYLEVADLMLPHIIGRPLALVRCPRGSEQKCFFQKHASPGWPDLFHKVRIREKSGTDDYLYIDDVKGLIAAAQMDILELHIWGAHVDKIEKPDRLVFDFDPGEGVAFDRVKEGARELRGRLQKLGLESFPLATGGKGIHVVVPLSRGHSWDQHRAFAEAIARLMAEDSPARYVANMSKAKRRGKIYIDFLRNQRGATAIAPYSTRARKGAYIAVPLSWSALSRLVDAHPASVRDAARLVRAGDSWKGYAKLKQALPLSKLKIE
jgi:bifunctional non-homologous end joining protein LigD